MDIFGNFSNIKGDGRKRIVRRKAELDFCVSDINPDAVGELEESERSYFSSFLAKSFIVLLFCILVFKLFFLQVVQGGSNQRSAEDNRIRQRVIEAKRGIITDSQGEWLVRNEPSFSLAVYPSDLPKKTAERAAIYQQISDVSGIPLSDIKKQIEANGLTSLDMVALKENIPHDDALLMEKKIAGITGVFMAKEAIREYQILPGLGHILGYTGKVSEADLSNNTNYLLSDKIGKTGLEAQYEQYLKGKNGIEQIEVDSKGSVVRILADQENKKPENGDDISLYMDKGLQTKTAEALTAGIAKGKQDLGADQVNSGVAIVMDVKTGGILSMVSLPDYNDNLFSPKISNQDYQNLMNDKTLPMLDRAISGIYPPGSISKIILASAGLSEGTITPSTSLVTPAAIKIGDYSFPDWKDHSYESTNVERAIAESNDIFFYSLGGGYDKIKGLGIDKMKQYWQLFGLGEKTGIDLPSEASGLLPDVPWKKKTKNESWYIGDTYHASIGQGDMLVTPIQMLRATAAVANGGTLLQPQLVKKISDSDGKVIKEFGPRVEKQNIVSQDVLKTVQEGMRMTVTSGSAHSIFPADFVVPVAGKTGTAQFLNNQKTHAWFECYAPYDNPQIAVLTMVEGGGEGFDVAAPIAKDILQYYFQTK